jgi:hypothetical protein
MGKLKDKIKGEMLKEATGFQYVKGSICRLDADPSPEEQHQEIIDRAEAGQCPRDEGEFKRQKDGRTICENCGLVLTDELMKKFGIKIQK